MIIKDNLVEPTIIPEGFKVYLEACFDLLEASFSPSGLINKSSKTRSPSFFDRIICPKSCIKVHHELNKVIEVEGRPSDDWASKSG